MCPALGIVCCAGSNVPFTVTLVNTGNLAIDTASISLGDVTLTCSSEEVGTASASTSFTSTGGPVPYNHKVVCTGSYKFDEAAFEALTGSYKDFTAAAAATGWTIAPATAESNVARVQATEKAEMLVELVSAAIGSAACTVADTANPGKKTVEFALVRTGLARPAVADYLGS